MSRPRGRSCQENRLVGWILSSTAIGEWRAVATAGCAEGLGTQTTIGVLSPLPFFAISACSDMHPFSSLGCSLHSSGVAAYKVVEQPKMAETMPTTTGIDNPAKETMPGGPDKEEIALLRDGRDDLRRRGRCGLLQRLWGCRGGPGYQS